MPELGDLENVDLRDVWPNETQDFTPWLAGNLSLLNKTLGLALELEAVEKSVGRFRADIVCLNKRDGSRLVIENQLEAADQRHLGQILIYAAGLDEVTTVVWIAASFKDEYLEVLDWLNRVTNERFQFFGLQIELWRIGKSAPAPRLSIVSKP